MSGLAPGLGLFEPEQFRMRRLEVFNWGTFSGRHDVSISDEGFLFVGRSGSGKSTLLDAISALLVPPRWVDFNAAAREAAKAGRDRNLVSYIRGAWAERKDDDSGEITTRYLRGGTTWSALALTYRNASGRHVVLVQILWLRGGAGGAGDVRRQFMIFERSFDLAELESFGQSNLDLRKLKQEFPDVFTCPEFRRYAERFRRMLGIESEMALRLLHKTQSAKSLGDLNTFLRDFMLDKPKTFEVADRLVEEFDELNAAHQAVVTARRQVEALVPARERNGKRLELLGRAEELTELLAGIDAYGGLRRIELLRERIDALRTQRQGLEGEIGVKRAALAACRDDLADLERRRREAGGDQVERWRGEKAALEEKREGTLRRRELAEEACRHLGHTFPDSPRLFAELAGEARGELERRESAGGRTREKRDALVVELRDKENIFAGVSAEVRAMERQPSNIPARMLELRGDIASGIGIPEEALPFIGELIEVKADEGEWRGAVERVLHGFALSLLVDERRYAALSEYVNSRALGRRLVYYRTGGVDVRQGESLGADSLVLKLEVKDCDQSEWLKRELRRRFDYACVDSIGALRKQERALTKEGLVKHSRSRHEKDDRQGVDDRRSWVLGFDNRQKLALYKVQAGELAAAISELQGRITGLAEEEEERSRRAIHCQTLVNLQWEEVDPVPLLTAIQSLEERIREVLEGNETLKDIAQRIERRTREVEDADKGLRRSIIDKERVEDAIKEHGEQLKRREAEGPGQLGEEQEARLAERFGEAGALGLGNLEAVMRRVERGITQEAGEVNRAVNNCERFIEKRFDEFVRLWPAEADGLDAALAAAPDFFAKLNRLEVDGLPAHERRFFELLQTQSHQNLAALSTYLRDARKEILERMDLVNASLAEVPFNRSMDRATFLRIDPGDRQLPEVREFKGEIRKALSHAWSHDLSRDPELAESRFTALRDLVERLSGGEAEDRRWRSEVLDVRRHMEFIGRESDEDGAEVEVYRSGSGKSGGQRQKLATTCLAAALRYQLGGNEHGVPMYAPVVLDEAFDKADNEFTALAMNIFKNFGFQMIVATPLKSVMTLEPFIGGACFIDISDRRSSGVLMIEYDSGEGRLRLPGAGEAEAAGEVPEGAEMAGAGEVGAPPEAGVMPEVEEAPVPGGAAGLEVS